MDPEFCLVSTLFAGFSSGALIDTFICFIGASEVVEHAAGADGPLFALNEFHRE